MDIRAEELTDAEIENLFAKGVGKGDTRRFLWHVGTAVVIGFWRLFYWASLELPAPDSAHRGDFARAKIPKDCATKRISGC